MTDTVSWNLHVNIREGRLEDFRALMGEMVSATEANEPGTQVYEWFLSDKRDRIVQIAESIVLDYDKMTVEVNR